MLKAEDLELQYGLREALRGVSFQLSREEIRSLLGPNGAGKTTAFNLLSGVDRPKSGRIYLDGKDITSLPINQRARMGLNYLLQKPSLFRQMTIKENIRVMFNDKSKGEKTEKTAKEILKKLDIEELELKKSGELSAGQRRKAEIARSLATFPTFLLLDEPFSGLDPISVTDLKVIIRDLKTKEGLGVMITDHKVGDTLQIADYNYLLKDGVIISEGNQEEILKDEKARSSYLGEGFKLGV